MSGTEDEYQHDVTRHSGWLLPFVIFLVTAALSALILFYYLAPAPTSFTGERPAPTARTDPVLLTIADHKFAIPANYLIYRSARQGGERQEVALFATLPDFRGYSDADGRSFSGNAQNSPIIYMLIREEPVNLPEAQRLARVYSAYVADAKGKPGPFGLIQYEFRDDSGYHGEDLLVGELMGRPVVLRCVRQSGTVPNPSCLRDVRFAKHVGLSYRFKRSQLPRWREIATGVDSLVRTFESKAQ